MQNTIPRISLVCLIALKIGAIIVYAPLIRPDTGGYVSVAETILASLPWLADRPRSLGSDGFRMIGYPALIAGAKVLFGAGWSYAVVAFQVLIGIVATVMLHRFVCRLMGHWSLGLIVAGSYALSLAFVYELHILTDGIYGHLLAIVMVLLADRAFESRGRMAAFVLPGLLLTAAFLLREFTLLLLLPIFGPLALLAAWRTGDSYGARAARFAAVVLPVFVAALAYASWNEARTGTRFVTTGARTAALLPLVQLEGRGLPVFDGDTVLDEAAQLHLEGYFFADVLEINRDLAARGLTGVQLSNLVRARYVEILISHPLAFAGHAFRNVVRLTRVKNLGNPLASFRAVMAFHESHSPQNIRHWAAAAFDSGVLLYMVAAVIEGLFVLLSAIVLLAYLLFPALYIARLRLRREIPIVWNILAALWISYIGVAVAYGLIRLEDRYLIGFAPFVILIGLFVTLTLYASFARITRARRAD